jgi:acyl-CoA thioesterase I
MAASRQMRLVSVIAAGLSALLPVAVRAGDGPAPPPIAAPGQPPPELRPAELANVPDQLSKDCAVKAPVHDGRQALRWVRRALKETRPLRVLAIGSSSTVGVGASSPRATYPVRLESDLEGFLKGFDVEMFVRGVNGEVAHQAADRIRDEVATLKPDLVVWQVGTNDALARVDIDDFADRLAATLDWLARHRIDVVLIDPQYIDKMADDSSYLAIVERIAVVARSKRVLLVHRYMAMADLAHRSGTATIMSPDKLHLNDLGYRCMAEYAARTIIAGILQADTDKEKEKDAKPQN